MRTVALGDVAEINPRGDRVADDEIVSFVGMAELDAESAAARPLDARPFGTVSKGYTVFRDRDVLAAKITPCWENGKVGQARLAHRIGVGSTEFHVVRPGPGLDARYLLQLLRQPRVRAAGELRMTGSAGQRRVPAEFVRALSVPLPPIDEQRRIARMLDRADATVGVHRRVLGLLDELESTVFHDVAGGSDPRLPLRSMGVDFLSGRNVLGGERSAHPFHRVIKVSAISSGRFVPEESKPMPDDYSPPDAHRLRRGDVLFGRASGSMELLGATAVVDIAPENLYLPDKVWRLVVPADSPVTSRYVLGVLRSASVRAFIRHNASGAAGVRNISKAKMLGYVAPLPSPERQREYVARVENVDARRRTAQRALRASATLLASLQYRAFRGES